MSKYVGYGVWFLISTMIKTDWSTIDKWGKRKQIGSGLRSGSPSSFWICSSSVSPCFEELKLFLLELEEYGSGPDQSLSVWQKLGNGIKEGTE